MDKGKGRGRDAGGVKQEQLKGAASHVEVRERDESGNDRVRGILHVGDAACVAQRVPQNEKYVGGSVG